MQLPKFSTIEIFPWTVLCPGTDIHGSQFPYWRGTIMTRYAHPLPSRSTSFLFVTCFPWFRIICLGASILFLFLSLAVRAVLMYGIYLHSQCLACPCKYMCPQYFVYGVEGASDARDATYLFFWRWRWRWRWRRCWAGRIGLDSDGTLPAAQTTKTSSESVWGFFGSIVMDSMLRSHCPISALWLAR